MAQPLAESATPSAEFARAALASIQSNDGLLFLTGVCHRADTVGTNLRLYGMRLMAREVQSYAQRFVVSGEARGELDHPLPTSRVFKHINARNVSHIFLELWWAGNELCATVQVLNTPSGQLVRRLYLNGERVAFASRGWATLREDVASGVTIVEDDFLLITFDCVRVGALGDLFKPVVGRCAAAAPARLLAARASFWAQLHSDTRPLWPFAPASRAHLYENWMTPAVELMRHDAGFRCRARLLLLVQCRGEGVILSRDALHCILARLASSEAADLFISFMPGFTAKELPSRPPMRLVSRHVQPHGSTWRPLDADEEDDAGDESSFFDFPCLRRCVPLCCPLTAVEQEGSVSADSGSAGEDEYEWSEGERGLDDYELMLLNAAEEE